MVTRARPVLSYSDKVAVSDITPDCYQALLSLQERNADSHAPWVYHGSLDDYFEKVENGRTIGFGLYGLKESNLVGIINLNEPVRGSFQSAYLGYYLDKQFQGQGLMASGLTLVINHAFIALGFHRLEANIQPGNVRSIELVKRLGFSKEGLSRRYLKIGGQWCDHERWTILVEDWKAIVTRSNAGNE